MALVEWLLIFLKESTLTIDQVKLARNYKIIPFEVSKIAKEMEESSIKHTVSAEITYYYWFISAGQTKFSQPNSPF